MNHRMRRIVETLACERRYGIADAKGSEYSGAGSTYKETGADTLNNFKSVAQRIGGTPEQVLMTYLLKHVDSINTVVREAASDERFQEGAGSLRYAQGEGIVSRLDDARNYLDLLECLLIDLNLIEPVRDEQGELYAQIGVGAADLTFPERAPWQYPNAARDNIRADPEGLSHRQSPAEADEQAAIDAESDRILKEAGLVEGLDGVWRGKTKIDESVAPDALREVPLCDRPSIPAEPTQDALRYGETGEL